MVLLFVAASAGFVWVFVFLVACLVLLFWLGLLLYGLAFVDFWLGGCVSVRELFGGGFAWLGFCLCSLVGLVLLCCWFVRFYLC